MKPVIVVHGGAGRIFKEREDGSRSGVIRAALKGYSILKQGGTALDAVEEAVVLMEDDPHFNAGNFLIFQTEILTTQVFVGDIFFLSFTLFLYTLNNSFNCGNQKGEIFFHIPSFTYLLISC